MPDEQNSRETPEESRTEADTSTSKNPTAKDRKCRYCGQFFTSSSLGRHLDQFLFKKKPDGVHDVEEIRRVRSGITRRQARTAGGKRDGTPDSAQRGAPHSYAGDADKGRGAHPRMMFNTPTWHATGVINDIPNPSRITEAPRVTPTQTRSGSIQLPDYSSRGANTNNPDTLRALELALREVLDNVKAATSRFKSRLNPFDFEVSQQTFPSLCLLLLPPPTSLFATHPFSTPDAFPLEPPTEEHLHMVRRALRSKVQQWKTEQLAADPQEHAKQMGTKHDQGMIYRTASQHEDLGVRHLELAFKHWNNLSAEARQETWQLEITRAFAKEIERRKSVDEQLARVQQEANQLRAQVARLGSCQWPREFALFPPDMLPISRDIARELDSQESQISPDSARWDYDNVVAKWKRVVMHDKSIGRPGVSYAGLDPSIGQPTSDCRVPRPGEDTTNHPNRLRPLQSASARSPEANATSTPPSAQYQSPYSLSDTRSPGPQVKRPRLMNGSDGPAAPSSDPPSSSKPMGPLPSWTAGSAPIMLSNVAAPSGQTPPPRQ
ncbi:hypothetical protein N7470_004341 [Penicillium chermesinum]|nr:hypothetical protein N7470_004341 [Penicillium chermesinum]